MVNTFSAVLLSVFLISALGSCLPDGDYKIAVNYEPVIKDDGWEIAPADEEGFNPAALQSIYDLMFSDDQFITTRSLLIVKNGKIVSESYFRNRDDINSKVSIQGITKSIVSLIFGFAWNDNQLNLESKLYEYIPGYFDGYRDKREITLGNVLEMTAGLEWDNDIHTIDLFNDSRFPSTVRIVLTKPFVSEAGKMFHYNHGTPQLAMGVMKEVYGLENLDSLIYRLFNPLGITDFVWEKHADGLHIGGLGLHLKPRDLAKIGQLMLQRGKWQDEQLIPEDWYQISTSEMVPPEKTGHICGYGYYWWVDRENNAYLAMGNGGQYLYIVPEKELVIVHTANPHVGSGYKGIKPEEFFSLAGMIIAANSD